MSIATKAATTFLTALGLNKRAITYQDFWGSDSPFGPNSNTTSGTQVTQENALRLVSVYFCVSLIADRISTLPIHVFRDQAGRSVQLDTPAWLAKPNTEMTRSDFFHRILVSLLLDGNAYVRILRSDKSGMPVEMIPIHPRRIEVDQDKNGYATFVLDGAVRLTRDEILHIPAFTMPGHPKGLSPIEYAKESVGLGKVAEEYGARFFGQGSTLTGVVQTPGAMTPDQAEVMARTFSKHHAGVRNSHLPGVLTGGAVWQPITVPPDQAQFLETRRFQKVEIANLYRVPPYMLDPTVASSWGSGVEEQNKMLIDFTLDPWLVRIEQAFSDALLPRGQFVKFNLDALLRGRTKERYEAYGIAITHGLMNPDEARAYEDLEPIPKGLGKKFYVPLKTEVMGAPPAPVPVPQAPATDTNPAPADAGATPAKAKA